MLFIAAQSAKQLVEPDMPKLCMALFFFFSAGMSASAQFAVPGAGAGGGGGASGYGGGYGSGSAGFAAQPGFEAAAGAAVSQETTAKMSPPSIGPTGDSGGSLSGERKRDGYSRYLNAPQPPLPSINVK